MVSLINVALGEERADLLVKGSNLVNVFSGEILEGINVAVKDGRIAYVGYEDIEGEEVIDARGLYLCPGFIDPHTHIDSLHFVSEYVRFSLPFGTTCVITDLSAIGNAAGIEGVRWFIETTEDLPMRVYFLCPALVPPFPRFETSAGFSYEDFEEVISSPRCLGLGETYWKRLLERDPDILRRISRAKNMGKTVEGHSAGARGRKLVAYISGGASSCHEATDEDEALSLLRLGVYVMIREGSVRRELGEIAKLKDKIRDKRGIMLCTDSLDPKELVKGNMDELVRRAISYGFHPIEAIQMATINPANYFSLKDMGVIAPGKLADMLLFEDLEKIRVKLVMVGGRVVFDGELKVDLKKPHVPEEAFKTFKLKPIKREELFIPYRGEAKLRVMDIETDTVLKEGWAFMEGDGENIPPDPSRDILKVAHISKRGGKPAIGFVRGMGMKRGAVATSHIWDTNNILVIGTNEEDMALSVNELLKNSGGIFIAEGGKIIFSLPLPIWGIISDIPVEELVERMDECERVLRELGCGLGNPLLVLESFPFTGLPFLRLTDKGLVDVRRGEMVSLFLD